MDGGAAAAFRRTPRPSPADFRSVDDDDDVANDAVWARGWSCDTAAALRRGLACFFPPPNLRNSALKST